MRLDRLREQVAFHLIGTPVEQPLRWVRSLWETVDRRRTPEWNSVRDEGQAIEELLVDVLQPTTNCIDVGCHLGAVLHRMQAHAPQGQHLAFEPTPYKWEWLKSRYDNVEVRREALSNKDGEATFYYQVSHSGFSGLRSHRDNGWETDTFQVVCAQLDDIVADRNIGFIKMDVEGAEPLVIRGAERLLRFSRPQILFECTLSGLRLYDYEPKDMYNLLCHEFGYDIYLIRDWLDRRSPLDFDGFVSAMSHPAQAFNFFASASSGVRGRA